MTQQQKRRRILRSSKNADVKVLLRQQSSLFSVFFFLSFFLSFFSRKGPDSDTAIETSVFGNGRDYGTVAALSQVNHKGLYQG